MTGQGSDRDTLMRVKINQETATVRWRGLQRFFAQGRTLFVHPAMDLVQVALTLSRDRVGQAESWIARGELARVSDAMARDWYERDALVWAVVVKPWVLVQDRDADPTGDDRSAGKG